jgi:predicted transcriptional regulator of viral defense system
MASRGTLVRVGHGVYHVSGLHLDHHDEFIFAKCGGATVVVSHESALCLREYLRRLCGSIRHRYINT